MKRTPDRVTAGICGLFCGTCPSYPEECHGCLSDKLRGECVVCVHGFRSCAKQKQVTYCWQCADFPCERLDDFSRKHIVNGICHHEKVIDELKDMSAIGVDKWVKKQTEQNTCPDCGELMIWYEKPHKCKG